jgi:hypothetical protein
MADTAKDCPVDLAHLPQLRMSFIVPATANAIRASLKTDFEGFILFCLLNTD